MSQLERQYDELEEVGRKIEQALRDAEDSKSVYVHHVNVRTYYVQSCVSADLSTFNPL